jgi:hypothetical protein
MRIRETPMRVNEKTTALDLLNYLGDLEEVLTRGGRIVAIPEKALIQIKTEFFEVRGMLVGIRDREELPEIDGDLDGLVVRMNQKELHDFFTFVDHVARVLSYFEEVGGELLPEGLPGGPER